jgi:peroxin-12
VVNATALTTSGFVGCYKCVYDYVGRERRCPVTGVATSTADLRKIIG